MRIMKKTLSLFLAIGIADAGDQCICTGGVRYGRSRERRGDFVFHDA